MMKKIANSLALALVLGNSICFGMESEGDRELSSVHDIYTTAQRKWSWALPKDSLPSTVIKRDIDAALCRVGNDPSDENVSALLKTIAKNQGYTNYSHMVFCECFVDLSKDDNVSSRKNAVSVVLSNAAVFFSRLYPFTQDDLLDEFNRLIVAD